jgi:tetratricopeptide (TPR) repeat protein
MKKCSSRQGFICTFLTMALLYSTSVIGVAKDDSDFAVLTKLKFFSWLVEDSPAVKRILQSADSEAIAQLEKSQRLLQQAKSQYSEGEYLLAEKNIAIGIKEMSRVSRKIKDKGRVERAHKKLFHELKQRVQTFADVFERVAKEKNDRRIDAMLDSEKLQKTVDEADALYHEGQLAQANQRMKQAADIVELALSDARDKDVLVHELSFDSLEDEYDYEKKRNESYVLLIRLLQEKRTVSDASRQYVNKIVTANKGVVKQAEKYVAKGDIKAAIKALEKSTDKLSRALRMAGAPF